MSLAESIQNKEAEICQIKDHEIVVVFDLSGTVVLEVHGGASSVDISPYLDQIRTVGGTTLVHNHPLGWHFPPDDPRHAGSSFTPEDIETACYAELAEIRAVGPKNTYSMRPPSSLKWSGEYWVNRVQPSQKKHSSALSRSTLHSVREGRKSREYAEANFWHEVWLLVAGDTALVYQRLEPEV